jgi:hypothetical protein
MAKPIDKPNYAAMLCPMLHDFFIEKDGQVAKAVSFS